MKEWVEKWKKHRHSLNLKPRTLSREQEHLSRFIARYSLNTVSAITPDILKRYRQNVLEKGLKPQTAREYLRSIKSFITFLRENGQTLLEPEKHLPYPKHKPARIPETLSVSEVLSILRALNGKRHIRTRAIVELFYATGIRRNELLTLDLTDINFNERTLYIRHAKGGRERIVPLTRSACKCLKEYITGDREKWQRRKGKDRHALFLTKFGERITTHTMNDIMHMLNHEIAPRIGLRKCIRSHIFRHSIATHLLERGLDIRYIQQLLGHEDIASTQIYTHVASAQLKKEIDKHHPANKIQV